MNFDLNNITVGDITVGLSVNYGLEDQMLVNVMADLRAPDAVIGLWLAVFRKVREGQRSVRERGQGETEVREGERSGREAQRSGRHE